MEAKPSISWPHLFALMQRLAFPRSASHSIRGARVFLAACATTAFLCASAFLAAESAPPLSAPDEFVRGLIETVDQACFERGDDAEQLRVWALAHAWIPVPSQELERHANELTTLIGGFTLENELGAFAVIQSEFKPPGNGHVCSLTTKLASATQHTAAKAAFAQRFGAPIAEELDRPEQHTDRYWIERGRQPPVKATIVHTPASRALTIRMIHGSAMPLRS